MAAELEQERERKGIRLSVASDLPEDNVLSAVCSSLATALTCHFTHQMMCVCGNNFDLSACCLKLVTVTYLDIYRVNLHSL